MEPRVRKMTDAEIEAEASCRVANARAMVIRAIGFRYTRPGMWDAAVRHLDRCCIQLGAAIDRRG